MSKLPVSEPSKRIPLPRKSCRLTRQSARGGVRHPLDQSAAELRNELARTPDDATLHARLGGLHYKRGNLAEAEACYRRAIALQPKRPSFHNNLGNVLCDRGNFREGVACYEQALALERAADPSAAPSSEAVVNLELARMERRLIHERMEYLEQASRLEAASAETMNALGGAYLLQGRREEALGAFRRAARLDPRNAQAARNLGFALALRPEGPPEVEAALEETAEALVRFPREARLFLHQGELFQSAGRFAEAAAAYRRALRCDPRLLEGFEMLGQLLVLSAGVLEDQSLEEEVLADLQAREEAARASLEGPTGAGASLDLALVVLARDRLGRAAPEETASIEPRLREALERAQAEDDAETEAQAAVRLAQALETAKRREEAARMLETATARRPQAARLWFERATLMLRAGGVEEAVQFFERALLAAPQEAYLYHSLRFAFEGLRRYRTEKVRFEAAVRAQPANALAYYQLAAAEAAVLKDDQALEHFQTALRHDPRLAVAHCGVARILQRRDRLDEAEAAYRRAMELNGECLEAHRGLESLRAARGLPPEGR